MPRNALASNLPSASACCEQCLHDRRDEGCMAWTYVTASKIDFKKYAIAHVVFELLMDMVVCIVASEVTRKLPSLSGCSLHSLVMQMKNAAIALLKWNS